MRKKLYFFVALLFWLIFSANFALAADGANCKAIGGYCDKACLTKPNVSLGGFDCPSGWECCGDPAEAQKKILGAGGLSPASSSSLNTKTSIFGNPLGENMGTVDRVIGSLQGYLNKVAATIALIFILIGAALYAGAALGKTSLAELGKKMVIVAVGGFVVVVAAPVIWAEIKNIIGGNPENVVSTSGAVRIVNGILPGFLVLVGLYAIIGFLIGAITMLLAAGDEKRMERGKTILKWVLLGTVIAIGAVIIARQIVVLLSGNSASSLSGQNSGYGTGPLGSGGGYSGGMTSGGGGYTNLGGYLGYGGEGPGGSGAGGGSGYSPLQTSTRLIRFDKPGQTEQIKTFFTNPSGQTEDVTEKAAYSSNNEKVASVSSTGLVTNTFVSDKNTYEGKAAILVQYQGAVAKVEVEVIDRTVCVPLDPNDASSSGGKVKLVFVGEDISGERFKQRVEEYNRLNTDPVNKQNFSLWRSDVLEKDICAFSGAFKVVVHGKKDRDYAEEEVIHLFEFPDDEKEYMESVRDVFAKILIHEIGHAAGRLLDEYTEDSSAVPDPWDIAESYGGSRNCFPVLDSESATNKLQKSCGYFKSIVPEFDCGSKNEKVFKGCNYILEKDKRGYNWYKSIERGMMGDGMYDDGCEFGIVPKTLFVDRLRQILGR